MFRPFQAAPLGATRRERAVRWSESVGGGPKQAVGEIKSKGWTDWGSEEQGEGPGGGGRHISVKGNGRVTGRG